MKNVKIDGKEFKLVEVKKPGPKPGSLPSKSKKPLEKTWAIYIITNQTNGKVYIGQTAKYPASQRWAQHLYNARKQVKHPLYNSMNKYGKDNFTFEIIATSLSQEETNKLEDNFIIKYDSRNRENGYNLIAGGYSRKDYIVSAETREKMSKAGKGKHKSPATEFKKGEKSWVGDHPALGRIPWNKGKKSPYKLTLQQITEIKSDIRSIRVLAKIYGVGKSTIQHYKSQGK